MEQMNNKQSSVEWLYEKMFVNHGRITIEEFEQAKTMHKDEIIQASQAGFDDGNGFIEEMKYNSAAHYYNETF